jgi:hypothetical protein
LAQTWLAGFILSILLHPWISRVKVCTQLVMFTWVAAALLIQHPNPLTRSWTFLIPLCAIWGAAGWAGPLSKIRLAPRRAVNLGGLIAVAGALVMGWVGFQHVQHEYPGFKPAPGRVEQVARFLQPRMQSGDIIVISSEDAPPLWYYSDLYGIPESTYRELEKHLAPVKRAFVVVSQREGQTLETAILQRKLTPADFDLDHAVELFNLDGLLVYECPIHP